MYIKNEISAREETLLNYLWDKNIPMSSNDILAELEPQGWKPITLFKTVQSLSDKEYLVVAGLEKSGKTYARQFVPAITRGTYYSQIMMEKGIDKTAIADITASLIGADITTEEGTAQIIDTLESIINELRSEGKDSK